jgi:hypothetical protein
MPVKKLPPYTVPAADKDLLLCGKNLSEGLKPLSRCKECGGTFVLGMLNQVYCSRRWPLPPNGLNHTHCAKRAASKRHSKRKLDSQCP